MTPTGRRCACDAVLVSSRQWRRLTRPEQDAARARGYKRAATGSECSACYARRLRRESRIDTQQGFHGRDEVLEEWHLLADPGRSVRANCMDIAPRLGMRWQSLERALSRAKAVA